MLELEDVQLLNFIHDQHFGHQLCTPAHESELSSAKRGFGSLSQTRLRGWVGVTIIISATFTPVPVDSSIFLHSSSLPQDDQEIRYSHTRRAFHSNQLVRR